MEFTKVRVRNLPTEEEYIQEKNKEYQVLKKMSKISAISNSIVALAMFAIICIGIAKHSSFDVGAFIIKTGRRPHMKSSIPLGMNAVSL